MDAPEEQKVISGRRTRWEFLEVCSAALISSDIWLIPLAAHEGHGKASGGGSIFSQPDV